MGTYNFVTIITKNQETKEIIKAEGFDYKQNHDWFTSHGFRYFGVNYNEKAEGRRYSYWGIDAKKFKAEYPGCYEKIRAKAATVPAEEVFKEVKDEPKPAEVKKVDYSKMKKAELIALLEKMQNA